MKALGDDVIVIVDCGDDLAFYNTSKYLGAN